MGLYKTNQATYPQMTGGLYVQDPVEAENR